MTVNLITIKLHAPWITGLKDKRSEVKGLCRKLTDKFGVSVLESDAQDYHQTIIISVGYLAHTRADAHILYEAIESFVESVTDAAITDITLETY